ncbi:hypothetical protein LXL04_033685 [Taraxacum kok-saghyz]
MPQMVWLTSPRNPNGQHPCLARSDHLNERRSERYHEATIFLSKSRKIDYDVLMGTPTVQALKSVARDGRTLISSIHQPSSKVFALFDDLFFAESGFPCPTKRNLVRSLFYGVSIRILML